VAPLAPVTLTRERSLPQHGRRRQGRADFERPSAVHTSTSVLHGRYDRHGLGIPHKPLVLCGSHSLLAFTNSGACRDPRVTGRSRVSTVIFSSYARHPCTVNMIQSVHVKTVNKPYTVFNFLIRVKNLEIIKMSYCAEREKLQVQPKSIPNKNLKDYVRYFHGFQVHALST
jgi:hypothetical protein